MFYKPQIPTNWIEQVEKYTAAIWWFWNPLPGIIQINNYWNWLWDTFEIQDESKK